MSNEQLLIPEKLKLGFQTRNDTYTGKLAFVVYYDKKGVLRKETSWNTWRDSKIDPVDFDNTPTEGFVLNKGVGGARQSYGWNARNEYIRVYDPRGFEFEISLPNLLFILRECNCNKGKGLEGKFVYAWDKNTLVLLPVNSQEYKQSMRFTDLQDKNISAKDFVPGAVYETRKQEVLIYIGRYAQLQSIYWHVEDLKKTPKKKYVFWNEKSSKFVFVSEPKSIAVRLGDHIVPNFAELVDKYNSSPFASKPVELFTKKIEGKNVSTFRQGREYTVVRYNMYSDDPKFHYMTNDKIVSIENEKIKLHPYSGHWVAYREESKNHPYNPLGYANPGWHANVNQRKWEDPNNEVLYVRLESGVEFSIEDMLKMVQGY